MNTTNNLQLQKPEALEQYLIDIFNANMDKIDANALNQLHFKGVVALIANLPAINQVTGDTYYVTEDGMFRVWSGTVYIKQDKTVVNATTMGALVTSLATKATPVNADEFGYNDTVNGNIWKKMSFTNLKAFLKTYFDGLYNLYSHPTGDGNLHVPATSTTNNGKVLTAGSTAGALSWTAITPTTPNASAIAVTPVGGIASTEVQSALAELDTEKAPKASPALTGTPTAPTTTALDNSTKIATTAMVHERAKLIQYAELYGSTTLDITHAGKFILITVASTITVPPDSSVLFPAGTSITLFRYGTGAVTVALGAGVSVMSVGSKKSIANQYESVTLVKTSVANNWALIGALS